MYEVKALKANVEENIERLKKRIDKWKVKFDKEPLYALSWSDGMWNDAAELEVLEELNEVMVSGGDRFNLEGYKDYVLKTVIRKSGDSSSSTSVPSNLADKKRLRAYSRLYERLGIYG